MRAAIIIDGKVENIIEVDALDALEGVTLVQAPDASIGDVWDGNVFTRPAAPLQPSAVPKEISPRQFRQALNHFGFRQQVDAAVAASGDRDLQDWYEFTSAVQ